MDEAQSVGLSLSLVTWQKGTSLPPRCPRAARARQAAAPWLRRPWDAFLLHVHGKRQIAYAQNALLFFLFKKDE